MTLHSAFQIRRVREERLFFAVLLFLSECHCHLIFHILQLGRLEALLRVLFSTMHFFLDNLIDGEEVINAYSFLDLLCTRLFDPFDMSVYSSYTTIAFIVGGVNPLCAHSCPSRHTLV